MCPVFLIGLKFSYSLRPFLSSGSHRTAFLLWEGIAKVTVLLKNISKSKNIDCILFLLVNLFCVCESPAPPTSKPGQVSLLARFLCLLADLRASVIWKERAESQSPCLPGNLEVQKSTELCAFPASYRNWHSKSKQTAFLWRVCSGENNAPRVSTSTFQLGLSTFVYLMGQSWSV